MLVGQDDESPFAVRMRHRSLECAYVWTAKLDVEEPRVAQLAALLSPDEHARAARYRTPKDHGRFVIRRAALRLGLGRLLGVAPARLRFGYARAGKPYLWEPPFARSLKFNLAHSDGLAVFGSAVRCEVGIDVERVCEHRDLADVAAIYFSSREHATLAALPPQARTAAFYRCWTRKEAYLKAIGSGLAANVDDVDVALATNGPPASPCGQPSEPTRWRTEALDLPAGYVGALVVERRASPLTKLKAMAG